MIHVEKNMSFDPCSQKAMHPGEEIVISGIAGRFPKSNNVEALKENLFNKIDVVTDDDRCWYLDYPEIPKRMGRINNINKFDASFFGINTKLANSMDPEGRMILEHAYEAVMDAGLNPQQLKGQKIGVFIAASCTDTAQAIMYDKPESNGYGLLGCQKSLIANRISYYLEIHGPSYTIDSGCSSSLYALDHGYRAIRSGQCDAALVGGISLNLHPGMSIQLSGLGVLSNEGYCKSFAEDANGFVRSEAISIIFLQKSKNAKRIYASIVHSKTNCDGYKKQGITNLSSNMQSTLFRELYNECNVSLKSVSYIEAHGSGTRVGDLAEMTAFQSVFCSERTEPLIVGSIKSNIGHTETASGMCGITKIIIANETSKIPPNLHFNNPRKDIEALMDGRIKVITEAKPWNGGYAGVSSLGVGGANAHVLLKSNQKNNKKNVRTLEDNFSRLVVASGRTEEAVETILADLENRSVNIEYIKLFHDIFAYDIPNHFYRGYTIVGDASSKKHTRAINQYSGDKRSIWFVFSGIGSQWPGMGRNFLHFPVFAAAIKKCDAVLKPHNIDIYDILMNSNEEIFDNVLNSFVGIAAIQIGLVDLLASVDIFPDKIIGHSFGEIGCAYADGCFTTEQMILAAYMRGLAIIETPLMYGSMAAVGLGYKKIKNLCPPDIVVACHNSPESSTISGPAMSIKTFVAQLTAQKIFAKEISSGNIAFHSLYIDEVGPKLLKYLKQIILEPKSRSTKWVSTSFPQSQWFSSTAQFSSAEYHTHNLLNPVLFEETCALIPHDAITIEIAPHGILQGILNRSLNPNVKNIALSLRGHSDTSKIFFQAIGELYNVGLQPQISKLYREITFPVSKGTPMIAPLIKWNHSDDCFVASSKSIKSISSEGKEIEITLRDDKYKYLSDLIIDGQIIIPRPTYLMLVWEMLGIMRGIKYTEMSVVFEDIQFFSDTILPENSIVKLKLSIQKGTGRFEILGGEELVVTGIIRTVQTMSEKKLKRKISFTDGEELIRQDIYQELKVRGYKYRGIFASIKSTTTCGSKGIISWANNWDAFLDNMIQMRIFSMDTRKLYYANKIEKIVINTIEHLDQVHNMPDKATEFSVFNDKSRDLITSGGIEIRGLKIIESSRRNDLAKPSLGYIKFFAFQDDKEVSLCEGIRLATNLVIENHLSQNMKILESIDSSLNVDVERLISPLILEALDDIPEIHGDVQLITEVNSFEENTLSPTIKITKPTKVSSKTNALILVGRNLLSMEQNSSMSLLLEGIKDNGFILTLEEKLGLPLSNAIQLVLKNLNLTIILRKVIGNSMILLLRKNTKLPKNSIIIRINNDNFSWLPKLQSILKKESLNEIENRSRILLVSEKNLETGLLGLVKCLRKEPGGEMIRGFLLQDTEAPNFNIEIPFYKNQLNLNLTFNVLPQYSTNAINSDAIWGSYCFLPLPEPSLKNKYHAFVKQLVNGDLRSLQWCEGPLQPKSSNLDLVKVVYCALNLLDMMLVTGKFRLEPCARTRFSEESILGSEYSGIDGNNQKIMGLVHSKALTNLLIIDRHLSWNVPPNWTLEDAATVPFSYAFSYHALYILGNMKKGDKILIHIGSSGIGQAAIVLALNEGCQVFTTVESLEAEKLIKERFPQIHVDHIGNSTDTSFELMIYRITNGMGVDIVLNSLVEEKLQASLRCLANGGRFLDIERFDMTNNTNLDMNTTFLKKITFCRISMDDIFDGTEENKLKLKKLLQTGLDDGVIKPLSRTVFSQDDQEAAFRYMATEKNIGKVIINILNEKDQQDVSLSAIPQFHCLPDRSYLIVGGLGGFGLELTDWLILRGAQNILLVSRSGITTGYQKMRIKLWESYGIKVTIISGKLAHIRQDCIDILNEANKMAPLDAIFNLAVANDIKSFFVQNNEDEFENNFKAKVWNTKNLDEFSRLICPTLRYFVGFSSITSSYGNADRSAYGMANSALERICEKRISEGFPALAIEWGPIADVGILKDLNKDSIFIGSELQNIASCLQVLDGLLIQSHSIVSCAIIAKKQFQTVPTEDNLNSIMECLGIKDTKSVDQQASFCELGMNSINLLGIKHIIENDLRINFTSQEIQNLTIAKLQDLYSKHEKDAFNGA